MLGCAPDPAVGGARAAVTTAPAAPGAVLHSERALVAVPTRPNLCWRTLAPGASVCAACKTARYASRAAQAADRPLHKIECAALAAGARCPPPSVRLALRLVAVLDAGGPASRTAGATFLPTALPDANKLELGAASAAAVAFAAAGAGAVPPRSVYDALARLFVNAHAVTFGDDGPVVGAALFPTAALANHACRPSAAAAFEAGDAAAGSPPRLVVRALARLAPGDTVTTAYTDPALPRPARRARLASSHLFDLDEGGAPDPEPVARVAIEGGAVTAVAHASVPPSVARDGLPASAYKINGVADDGSGATAWVVEAAAAHAPAPPASARPRVHVVAWGPSFASGAGDRLARVAEAAARAARAAARVPDLAPPAALAVGRPVVESLARPLAPAPTSLVGGALARALTPAAIAAGDLPFALSLAAAALPALEATHVPGLAARVNGLAVAARLAAEVGGRDTDAAVWATRAADEAAVGAGRGSPLEVEMRVLAAQLAGEGG